MSTISKILLTVLGAAALGAVVGTMLTSSSEENTLQSLGKSAKDWANDKINNLKGSKADVSSDVASLGDEVYDEENSLNRYNL